MKISKVLASNLAADMTKKSRDKAETLKKIFNNLVRERYDEAIPKSVKEMVNKHPEYFSTTTTIRLDGMEFDHECVTVSPCVIREGNGANAWIRLNRNNSKLVKELTEAKNAYQKAEKAAKDLKNKIESTLLGLGTTKKIAAQFPEIEKDLPRDSASVRLAIVPDLDKLRLEIKNQ